MSFLVCNTQWATSGMGERTGLRYADCITVLDRYLPRWQRDEPAVWAGLAVDDLMFDVQVIESGMLNAWGEMAEASRRAPPATTTKTIGAR